MLIDEARLMRRLRGRGATGPDGQGPLAGQTMEAIERHELLKEIDEAVRRGRELIAAARPAPPPAASSGGISAAKV